MFGRHFQNPDYLPNVSNQHVLFRPMACEYLHIYTMQQVFGNPSLLQQYAYKASKHPSEQVVTPGGQSFAVSCVRVPCLPR